MRLLYAPPLVGMRGPSSDDYGMYDNEYFLLRRTGVRGTRRKGIGTPCADASVIQLQYQLTWSIATLSSSTGRPSPGPQTRSRRDRTWSLLHGQNRPKTSSRMRVRSSKRVSQRREEETNKKKNSIQECTAVSFCTRVISQQRSYN